MGLISRSWLEEILLNITKNIVQRLNNIIPNGKIITIQWKTWWKETLTFAKQPARTNLERAGQYLRGHSLFI